MINLIIYVVSAIFTYGLGIISKKLKWNETLPIPIQNIFVGLIVFAIAMVLTDATNPTELAEQIFMSMGGVGTATLGYDTKKIGKGG